MAWNCDVSLEPGNVYVEVWHTGTDIVDVAMLVTQAQVLAEEYGLVLVPKTQVDYVQPQRKPEHYKRVLRVYGYPKSEAA